MMDDASKNGKAGAIWRVLAALLLMAGAMVAVVGRTGPAQAQDVTKTDATVRVVHASPGAPNVDVLIDGQAVVKNLAFGAATEYFPVPEGDHKIQITPTGQGADAALIDSGLNVDAGDAYVFLAMNRLKDIEGKLFKVNTDSVDKGKARVRLIHASPDAGKVDVSVTGGDKLFGGVSFKDATDYKDVDAGTYSLDVKNGDGRVLLTAQNIHFADGQVFDVVLLGQIADKTLALLPLATIVSVPCAQVLGLNGSADDSCVRVVHAAPGTSQVDLYLNDSPLAKGVAFGKATEFIAVPKSDQHKLQVVAAGGTPGNSDLLDDNLTFDSRKAYEVVITGNPDDLQAKNSEIDLSPLPAGQARIRVIHASPDTGSVDVVVADGPTLFGGVDYRDITNFKTVDAATYKLQLKKGDTVALAGDVTLDAGMVYDAIVIGRTDDKSLALLVLSAKALVRQGGVATPESQGTAVAGTAEATVVNATTAPGQATVVPTAGAVGPTPTP
jgi:hypothetical protein